MACASCHPQTIQNAIEMGFDAANGGIAALLAKLRTLPYYPDLFTFAFGDADINEARMRSPQAPAATGWMPGKRCASSRRR